MVWITRLTATRPNIATRGARSRLGRGPDDPGILLKADPARTCSRRGSTGGAVRRDAGPTTQQGSTLATQPSEGREATPRTPVHDGLLQERVPAGCTLACPHPTISGVKAKDRAPEQSAELKAWDRDHAWHPNQLRHSMGTQLRREFDLETARGRCSGIPSANTTEIYAERDRTVAARAIEQVG